MPTTDLKATVSKEIPDEIPGGWPPVGDEANVVWHTEDEVHCIGFDSLPLATAVTMPRQYVTLSKR